MGRHQFICQRRTRFTRLGVFTAVVAAAACWLFGFGGSAMATNAEDDFLTSGTALTGVPGNWSAGTPTATSDVTFTNSTYMLSGTTNTMGAAAFSIGTLNDLDTTQTMTITDTAGSNTTITLNGGGDTVAGSSSGDLIYLAPSTNLTVVGNGGKIITFTLAASGTFDVGAGSTLNMGAEVNGASSILYKTGAGLLQLGSTNGNGNLVGLVILGGTVQAVRGNGSITTGTITLGGNQTCTNKVGVGISLG